MENTKIAVLPRQVDSDADCFIRLCDSHQQRLRRQSRMKADRRKKAAASAAKNLMFALLGAAATIVVLTMIF